MILFNTLDYDPNKEVVKFMDGKLRSKEAFVASGFGATFVDGNCRLISQAPLKAESLQLSSTFGNFVITQA